MKPVPKVQAAGTAGAAATLLVFVAYELGIDVPPEVAAALATVLGFAAGWLKAETK